MEKGMQGEYCIFLRGYLKILHVQDCISATTDCKVVKSLYKANHFSTCKFEEYSLNY